MPEIHECSMKTFENTFEMFVKKDTIIASANHVHPKFFRKVREKPIVQMPSINLPEKLILRFGLAAIGLFCWDYAGQVLNNGGTSIQPASVFFSLGLLLLGFGLF